MNEAQNLAVDARAVGSSMSPAPPSSPRSSWPELDEIEELADDVVSADDASGVRASKLIEVGTIVGGRYRIDRHLARGGMGSVWVATDLAPTDPSLRRVALKTMTACADADPQGHERFRRETALAQGLVGPHFPRVSGSGVDRGVPFLALKLLDGETLMARLEREGRLSIRMCRWLVREVCSALGAAHALGIVHRDVTPKNIFLIDGPNGLELKLLDLGIAKHSLFGQKLTATGMLVGSPHYMSPEQVANVDVGYRTDLWSAAVVVYRALTGRRPFPGATGMDVLAAALRQPAISASSILPELGAGVDRFFATALAKSASGRFVTADQMATACEQATAHLVDVGAAAATGAARDEDQSTTIARRDYVAFAAVASRESAADLAGDDVTAIAAIHDSTDEQGDARTRPMTRRMLTRASGNLALLAPIAPGPIAHPVALARRADGPARSSRALMAFTAFVTFVAAALMVWFVR